MDRCRGSGLFAAASLPAQQRAQATASVSAQQLLDGLKDPTRWLMFGGDYNGQRHSPLTQITPDNVNRLQPQWTFQTETLGRFETTPLVLRRRPLRHRAEQRRVGARRAHRPPDLALPARAARRTHRVLRAGQPRVRRARRPAVHDHARRAPPRPRHEDRRRRLGRRRWTTTRRATRPRSRRSS